MLLLRGISSRVGPWIHRNTLLQELALADDDRSARIDALDLVLNLGFERAIEHSNLKRIVGCLGNVATENVSCLGTDGLLHRGLNTLLCDDQRLDSNQVAVFGNNVENIVNLSTVSTDLSTDVVGLMVVTDKGSQCILSNCVCDTETEHNVHLGEVTIEFLLCHFIDTSHDVLVRLTDGLTDVLVVPWISRRSNRVPTLGLPLVSLLTGCCSRFCAHLLCHGTHLGGYLRGLPL